MEKLHLNMDMFNEHLKAIMQNLMLSNDSTDITLVCEDKTKFKAHKFVLNACSPVFQSIIIDLPQNNPVIYLRGVLAQEMKSILQFMYLGQVTINQDKMNDFFNVAKSLEIKKISKDIECDIASSANDQECNTMIAENEIEKIVNSCDFAEDKKHMETKLTSRTKSKDNQYLCSECDKPFTSPSGLRRHIKSVHEGQKFSCEACGFKAYQKWHLSTHIQDFHE